MFAESIPPREDKSPVLASAQGSLGVADVARQMRRLIWPIGTSARRGVLMAKDFEAQAVYRKAIKERGQGRPNRGIRAGRNKEKGGGRGGGAGNVMVFTSGRAEAIYVICVPANFVSCLSVHRVDVGVRGLRRLSPLPV